MTTSAYCKHCKVNPINLYKKDNYCYDCGAKKQKLETRTITFGILTVIFTALFIESSLSLLYHQEVPLLTVYWGLLVTTMLALTGYSKNKADHY